MKVSIQLLSEKLYFRGVELDNPALVTIPAGVTAVVGANGAGKTTLADIILSGRNFRTNRILSPEKEHPVIKKITFEDIHSLSGLKVEYYQQRYEATSNDDIPSVRDVVGDAIDSPRWIKLSATMRLPDIADRKINYLSSGELRKLLIINTLVADPVDLLILDNPYIGLDSPARMSLDSALHALSAESSIMLLVSDPKEIPDFTDCIVPMMGMEIKPAITGYSSLGEVVGELYIYFDYAVNTDAIPQPPAIDSNTLASVVDIRDITVNYGPRCLFSDFSWHIAPGQHWGLAGPNGSGKSTLLSLLTADNPKAYSLDISLFGRRRGSGESIWDIKRRIGYISPELSLHFHPAGTVATIIAQGLNDTNGLYHSISPAQAAIAAQWMDILHLSHLADRPWSTLSTGERQLALLARVFIKQPRLMIFDEPFHGLDFARKRAVRALINYFAARAEALPLIAPCTIIVVSHYDDELPECLSHFKTLSPR